MQSYKKKSYPVYSYGRIVSKPFLKEYNFQCLSIKVTSNAFLL